MTFTKLAPGAKAKLNDGNEIPVLGLGVYEMVGNETERAVIDALELGYRHIDTAEWYENEAECGRGIRAFCESTGTPRSEIFYTTKLKDNWGYEHTKKAIDKSIAVAGVGYIDLYLVHGPYPDKKARLDAWKAMEEAVKEGKIRSIGVSNFANKHIQEILDHPDFHIVPAVNQIDLHPFMQRPKEVEFCRKHGIVLEMTMRFTHPVVTALASKYNVTPAQLLLRYGLQKGFVVIPKSTKRERIAQNMEVFGFDISEEDMEKMDGLEEYLVTDWDPIGDPSV